MDRVAVLVDGDNIAANLACRIEDIGKGQGRVDVMRVYADASRNSGWLDCAGFRVVHAGFGKNAADLLLSIDAMELALRDGVDRFVIASSDGDFVHLAQRLRERGAWVVGVGERKSPAAFRAACCAFHVVAPQSACAAKAAGVNGSAAGPAVTALDRQIRTMIARHSEHGQGMRICELGQEMRRAHDVRVSHLPDRNWRAYLAGRPNLYALDPAGPEAKARFRAEAFANAELTI